MKMFDAWAFPDGETQLPDEMTKVGRRVSGRLTWQYHKYEAARSLCRCRRVAVDVGAHVGLWSYWMALDFEFLYAFEPDVTHRMCWDVNVPTVGTRLYPCALGARAGTVDVVTPVQSESGGTYVMPSEYGVEQRTLDSFAFDVVDLLKIDCEGYEPAVIEGAVETITRCHPVIVVEQHANGGQPRYGYELTAAVDWLIGLGGRVETVLGSDTLVCFR